MDPAAFPRLILSEPKCTEEGGKWNPWYRGRNGGLGADGPGIQPQLLHLWSCDVGISKGAPAGAHWAYRPCSAPLKADALSLTARGSLCSRIQGVGQAGEVDPDTDRQTRIWLHSQEPGRKAEWPWTVRHMHLAQKLLESPNPRPENALHALPSLQEADRGFRRENRAFIHVRARHRSLLCSSIILYSLPFGPKKVNGHCNALDRQECGYTWKPFPGRAGVQSSLT